MLRFEILPKLGGIVMLAEPSLFPDGLEEESVIVIVNCEENDVYAVDGDMVEVKFFWTALTFPTKRKVPARITNSIIAAISFFICVLLHSQCCHYNSKNKKFKLVSENLVYSKILIAHEDPKIIGFHD